MAFVKTTDRASGVKRAIDLLGMEKFRGKDLFIACNTQPENAGNIFALQPNVMPQSGLRALQVNGYLYSFDAKTELADTDLFDADRLRKFHQEVLRALGFLDDTSGAQPHTLTVEWADFLERLVSDRHEKNTAHRPPPIDGLGAIRLTPTDVAFPSFS